MRSGSCALESTRCLICTAEGRARPFYSHRRDRWLQRIGIRYRCRWVMCMGCGLLYQDPRPSPQCMSTMYAKAYRSGLPSAEHLSRKQKGAEERFAWITRVLGVRGTRQRVLDVGCSEGSLLAIFQRHGWEAYGVEPTPSFAQWGREHYGLSIHVGSFDQTCFMRLVRDRMASSGAVFVEVPDLTRPEGDIAGHLYGAPHLYGFSPSTLKRFLGRAGFRVVEIEHGPAGIRALVEQGAVEKAEEVQSDLPGAYCSLRRRLLWHRACFFLSRGWKDALKCHLNDALGPERTEALLARWRARR